MSHKWTLLAVIGAVAVLGVAWYAGGGGQAVPAPTAAAPYQVRQATCEDCRIVLEAITTLGTADGPGALPTFPGPIAADSRGRYYVVPRRSGEMVAVFDSDGRFMDRIGKEGEGPGELVYPRNVFVMSGDSIHIRDSNLGRVSVFGPDYEFVRSYDMLLSNAGIVPLPSDVLLVNGAVPTADRIGYALHRLDPSGHPVLSFDPYVHTHLEPVWMRIMGVGSEGVWAVSRAHEHVLRLFDPASGEVLWS